MLLPLKELRKNRNMTQADLSKSLNISASSIGMWEQGRREPDLDNLNRIADFFNVSTDYLLGRKILNDSSPLSTEQKNVLNVFGQLNKPHRQMILNMMSALVTQQAATIFGNVINNHNTGSGNFFYGNNYVSPKGKE